MIKKSTLLVPCLAVIALATSACSMWPFGHHQQKSSFKIIPVGDNNPNIIESDAPERAGTVTRTVDVDQSSGSNRQ